MGNESESSENNVGMAVESTGQSGASGDGRFGIAATVQGNVQEMCREQCMDAGNSRITVKVAGRLAALDDSTGCLTRGPSVVRLQIPNHHGNKMLLFAGSSLPP